MIRGNGRGIQGTLRPHAPQPARRALSRRRADPKRARGAPPDDALRRDEAPAGARGGQPRNNEEAWAREAPLPEPRPDQARPRQVGEQVRGAMGGHAHRPQASTGGQNDGEGFRDLHQDDARAALGGDHRQRDEAEVHLRRRHPLGLDDRLRLRGRSRGRRDPDLRGREPRGGSAAPARPELQRPVERRRAERGNVKGHLGHRARGRLVPPDGYARPAARGRQRRDLRRLADDPLRTEDPARDRRAPDHARLPALLGGGRMSVETKLVTGVDFVCVPTQDIARAMDFYENVLGLEPSKRWGEGDEPMGAEFEPGDVAIALLNNGKLGIEFEPSRVPIAYQVNDVEAARAELESRGVTFVADTMDSGVCHMAHFKDPDGNVLMLHNRYAPKDARPEGMS